jgi:hypothetical protein
MKPGKKNPTARSYLELRSIRDLLTRKTYH